MLRFTKHQFLYRSFRYFAEKSIQLRHYVDVGSYRSMGIWIAPRFCSIGEFYFPRNGSSSVKWYESIVFSEYDELHAALLKIVNKRWLRGAPVTLSLATADIFVVPLAADAKKEDAVTEILPVGISPDSVDYAVLESRNPAFACIRQYDIDFWDRFCKETGFFVGSVVPSGILWSRFIDEKNEISFSLPTGTFVSMNSEGSWKGSVFIPSTTPNGKNAPEELGFNAPVQSEYAWCASLLLPALEGILLTQQHPSFNLNMNSLAAEKMIDTGKKIRRFCLTGIIVFTGIIAVLFAAKEGLHYWYMQISSKNGYDDSEKFAEMKKQKADIEKRILLLQTFISPGNSVAKIIHDAGSIVGDNIWYSEMKIETKDGMNIAIIGHALSESVITRLLYRAEHIDGIKKAHLEYTEKVSEEQVQRSTGGLRSIPLFRFRLLLDW